MREPPRPRLPLRSLLPRLRPHLDRSQHPHRPSCGPCHGKRAHRETLLKRTDERATPQLTPSEGPSYARHIQSPYRGPVRIGSGHLFCLHSQLILCPKHGPCRTCLNTLCTLLAQGPCSHGHVLLEHSSSFPPGDSLPRFVLVSAQMTGPQRGLLGPPPLKWLPVHPLSLTLLSSYSSRPSLTCNTRLFVTSPLLH